MAGGAGVTPFIAIIRDLKKKRAVAGNTLIFSNKTKGDVILENELRDIFRDNPKNLILTLTREKKTGYEYGRIDESFLRNHVNDFNQNFYICGPPRMVSDLNNCLKQMGVKAESIIIE